MCVCLVEKEQVVNGVNMLDDALNFNGESGNLSFLPDFLKKFFFFFPNEETDRKHFPTNLK